MKIFYTDHFVLPLPAGHRFPMEKYAMLRRRVAEAGLGELVVPPAATDEQLTLVHDPAYLWKVLEGDLSPREARNIGFPWSPELIERSRRSVGATIEASRAALQDGFAVNLAGGTHHAFRDRGEGFCVFNDAAVAIRCLQAEGAIERATIVDTDVHQGNGTAALFHGDPFVTTFSIHGLGNYPFRKERSDLDIALPDGAGDDAFLEALDRGLEQVLQRGKNDLVIYLAGADPHEGDKLGKLSVTTEGLAERDRRVFDRCFETGAPIAIAMAGGYGHDIATTVNVHFNTVATAASRFASFNA